MNFICLGMDRKHLEPEPYDVQQRSPARIELGTLCFYVFMLIIRTPGWPCFMKLMLFPAAAGSLCTSYTTHKVVWLSLIENCHAVATCGYAIF